MHVNEINELVVKTPEIPQLSLIPRDAFYGDTEVVPFKESAGRIIAEFIYVYPPGIPILLPGEVISQENIDYIIDHVEVGLPVKGPEDRSIQNVKVIVKRILYSKMAAVNTINPVREVRTGFIA